MAFDGGPGNQQGLAILVIYPLRMLFLLCCEDDECVVRVSRGSG